MTNNLESPQSSHGMNNWRIAAYVLIALTIGVRFVNLGADPPMHFSVGQGIFTDPGAYTNYARQAQLFNDSNPLNDDRFPLFEYSAVAFLARPAFVFFGNGQASGALVALLFSLSTILLIFLVVRRAAGIEAGVFFLLFMILNQNQYQFGRLAFLEHGMIFFGALTFWVLHNLRRNWKMAALAGVVLPCAFLIGKAHGLVFVGVFAAYFFWSARIKPKGESVDALHELKTRYLPFIAGAALTCLIWYALMGHETLSTVSRYIQEQSTGIYGAPDALESLTEFHMKFISLGAGSKLWQRMPEAGAVALALLAMFLYHWAKGRGRLPRMALFSDATFVFLVWTCLYYLALFGWNYRPFRYQLVIVYSVCALGGIGIAYFWKYATGRLVEGESSVSKKPAAIFSVFAIIFYAALFILLTIVGYEINAMSFDEIPSHFNYHADMPWILGLSLLGVALLIVINLLRRAGKIPRLDRQLLVVLAWLLPLFCVTIGGWWYKDWLTRPTYTMQATSVDLAKILGPGAVISGTFGVSLCQNNDLRAITHMFGVADPDSSFFERFPVTHLLLDVPSRRRFSEIHPTISRNSTVVYKYYITNRPVDLIRVAGITENKSADEYRFSAFERAQLALSGKLQDPEGSSMRELVNMDSSNIAVNMYMGLRMEQDSNFQDARFFYQCAVDASPTDFNLRAELGRLYFDMYRRSGDPLLRQSALLQFREAYRLNPGSSRIENTLEEVENANQQ